MEVMVELIIILCQTAQNSWLENHAAVCQTPVFVYDSETSLSLLYVYSRETSRVVSAVLS